VLAKWKFYVLLEVEVEVPMPQVPGPELVV
jgi:hypothetical protein